MKIPFFLTCYRGGSDSGDAGYADPYRLADDWSQSEGFGR